MPTIEKSSEMSPAKIEQTNRPELDFKQGEKIKDLYFRSLAIEAQLLRLRSISNPPLYEQANIRYYKSCQDKINKEIEHRQLIDGVIAKFDERNVAILDATAKPNAKAQLAVDVNGNYYLSGHGSIHEKKGEDGQITKFHAIDTVEGVTDTNEYLRKLILANKIPPFSEVRVLSCSVAELDITTPLPLRAKAIRGTTTPGLMYHLSTENTPVDEHGHKLVAAFAEGQGN